MEFEVIVAGLGGVGSGCLYWLSKLTKKPILGIEQFALGHDNGGSQDYSRIIRLAYEAPKYTNIASHQYSAWSAVEHESGVQLVHKTGLLVLGPKDGKVKQYADAMRETGIPFEELGAQEAMERWPQFKLEPHEGVVFQADGGIVEPWKANAVHVNLARANGAKVMDHTKIEKIELIGTEKVKVITNRGTFVSRRLVLACGAWTNKMLAHVNMKLPIKVTKEQVTFFATPHVKKFSPANFPVWIHYTEDSDAYNPYGFPVFGVVGTKAGLHQGGKEVDPDNRTFEPDVEARNILVKHLEKKIPESLGPVMYTKTCLYANVPDDDFIVDTLPNVPQISVFVGAGHAYKWASFMGLVLSQIALFGKSKYDVSGFAFRQGVQPVPLTQSNSNKAKL